MATGAKHKVLTEVAVATSGDEERPFYKDCRCTIGEDHKANEIFISQFDPDEDELDEVGEPLDVYQAADIWRSNGEDADYTFGYGEDELREAADED
ncbi:hypothetical protein [Pseudarthrobacter sp. BIM B-2242]|uniref:hypothetical protein n=1 Tax=Pseudarthrobacter sp. BIM B-2242 TaxID=2772401 RepID=UPI00168B836D|nr:hypothetical protein [Pseudarthrobacter sp. BIM B-2242]QOD06189.1 hypothetical protein IDT60_21145 [Pseudarthrobacter sp. BIM B-2242]